MVNLTNLGHRQLRSFAARRRCALLEADLGIRNITRSSDGRHDQSRNLDAWRRRSSPGRLQ